MKISNHRLVEASWIDSPNHGGSLDVLDTAIIHYTGGGDALSSVQWLCNPRSQASAHLVIGRDGRLYQLIPFDTVAWHAGRSAWTNPNGTLREGYNKYSIGIELDNAGILESTRSGFVSWFGRSYPKEEVYYGTHRNETGSRYWHRFTETQVLITEEICRLLIEEYGIKYILGHEEVSPRRKQDPGPAFPLDKLRDRIFYASSEDGPELEDGEQRIGVVTSTQLNIRSGPGAEEKTVANPLEKDTRVRILEAKSGWYRVLTEIEGWVSSKYVEINPGT